MKTDENRNILFAGVSSWENPQTNQVSEGLQQLLGNISQLFEKGILGRDGEETWGSAGVSYVARNALQVCTANWDRLNSIEL